LRERPDIRYIQYWSDPIALSGINPEDFSFRRYPFWVLERVLLGASPSIVYGTETLAKFQQLLFPALSARMSSVDISYSPDEMSGWHEPETGVLFGYIGDADPRIRNILPLYEYFRENPEARLRICGAHAPSSATPVGNVEILERVPLSVVPEIEAVVDVFVAVLNHNCIQLPGKIFYQANTPKHILVILDGIHRDVLAAYLASFDRFTLCENDYDSIGEAVRGILDGSIGPPKRGPGRLAPRMVAEALMRAGE
jgi:hypothetical protein